MYTYIQILYTDVMLIVEACRAGPVRSGPGRGAGGKSGTGVGE